MKNLKKIILFFCVSLFGANCLAIAKAPNPVDLQLPADLQTLLVTLLKKYPNDEKLKILDDAELEKGKCDHPECCKKRLALNRDVQTIYFKNILEAVQKDPVFLERWLLINLMLSSAGLLLAALFTGCMTLYTEITSNHKNILIGSAIALASGFVIMFYKTIFKLEIYPMYCKNCCAENYSSEQTPLFAKVVSIRCGDTEEKIIKNTLQPSFSK